MMRKLYDMATATEKTLCRTLVLSAALMAGCISGNGTGDTTDANVEAENIAKTPFTGIVLYSGNKTLRIGNGFYAVPLGALGA